MLVLITRPRPRAESTARLLRKRGHSVMIDPAYDIVPSGSPVLSGRHDAIILTSTNAVAALDQAMLRLPVFAVGTATARAARAAGALDVTAARGDWQSLAQTIVNSARIRAGARLLHLAGKNVRGDLGATLRRAGFAYERCVVYEARERRQLARRARLALAEQRIGAVLLFSPRAAELWLAATARDGLCDQLRQVRAVCISDATAAVLDPCHFREVLVAGQRDHRALADCLDGAE